MTDPPDTLSLQAAAARADVHYNTIYRWVRSGRLRATQVGGEWQVDPAELERAKDPARRSTGRRGRPDWIHHRSSLLAPLTAGDLEGSWGVVQSARVGGAGPEEIVLDLLAPALHEVGEGWAAGTLTVEAEHRATAVATRILGRLSSEFSRPGRKRGTVLVGGAPGDPHAFAVMLVSEVLRGRGWRAIELGADVPVDSWARAARAADSLQACVLIVGAAGHEVSVAEATLLIGETVPHVTIVVGGPGVPDPATAELLGSQRFVGDLRDLDRALEPGPELRSA